MEACTEPLNKCVSCFTNADVVVAKHISTLMKLCRYYEDRVYKLALNFWSHLYIVFTVHVIIIGRVHFYIKLCPVRVTAVLTTQQQHEPDTTQHTTDIQLHANLNDTPKVTQDQAANNFK